MVAEQRLPRLEDTIGQYPRLEATKGLGMNDLVETAIHGVRAFTAILNFLVRGIGGCLHEMVLFVSFEKSDMLFGIPMHTIQGGGWWLHSIHGLDMTTREER